MSEQEPGPTHSPYGQSDPYGQPSPYGQQPSYGMAQQPTGERRPGTVTAAAWITIVLSAITALLFGFTGLALLVARDQVIAEMEKVPEFQDANIDADAAVGVLVAIMAGLVIWAIVAIILAVLVLRRSNVSRILLVISSAVTALFSLLSYESGVSLVLLLASVAVIVLLFTGGAGDWFKRLPAHSGGGYPGAPTGYPSDQYGSPYGVQPGQDAPTHYPSADTPYGQTPPAQPPAADNPYGQQPPSPADNPSGQQPPPAEGGPDYPPRDYPGR